MQRRRFLQTSLLSGITSICLPGAGRAALAAKPESAASVATAARYQLTHKIPAHMYDGQRCWVHPRAGIVPGAGDAGLPRVVMTMNTLDVSGSDVFKEVYGLATDDLCETWSKPKSLESLAMRQETHAGQIRPVAVSDFWPRWHAASKKLLGIGHTVVYSPDFKIPKTRPRHTSYSTYDPQQNTWNAWQKLAMPEGETFHDCGAGSVQRADLAGGNILLPVYYRPTGKNSRVTVTRCAFDGQTLRYQEHGDEIAINDTTRGLHEPSLAQYDGRFFLTLRNDKQGFVTRGKDGLTFEKYRPWKFDDGTDLGNYNTQTHWVTHSTGLFLVYTRRGANNDHVFRHRAPLFMAQVDPDRLCVIRATEQVIVPERGARLGNFGVVDISPDETWVTVSEWMQTWGPEHRMPVDNKYGANGSIWIARLRWNQPNGLFQA